MFGFIFCMIICLYISLAYYILPMFILTPA